MAPFGTLVQQKIMRRHIKALALIVASFTLQSVVAGTPIYTANFESPLPSYITVTANTFSRAGENFSNFWDFCKPNNCYGYDTPDVIPDSRYFGGIPLSESFNIFEGSDNYRYFPYADISVVSSKVESDTSRIGLSVKLSTNQSLLENIPKDRAVGLDLTELYLLHPDKSSHQNLNFTFSSFNSTDALQGAYVAELITTVNVLLISYTSENGVVNFLQQPILSYNTKSGGDTSANLSHDLAEYPAMAGSNYYGYSVSVRHQFAVMATSVPEPSLFALAIAGIFVLFALNPSLSLGTLPLKK